MREVAELAGASLKTVSRVINGEGHVNPELSERVLAAVRTLDYRPNLQAGFLRRSDGKTQTIGLLVENISNPFSSGLHRAIEDAARKRNVIVFAGSLDEDEARERELADAFLSRRVDGLIIVPAGTDQAYLAREQEAGTPLVFLDRPSGNLEADTVVATNFDGGFAATMHLIAHGHRRIAYIGDYATIYTGAQRLLGYRKALEVSEIAYDERIVIQGSHSSDEAQAALTTVLKSENPPTAIFASQNFVTLGAIRTLHSMALQEKIALVGFDEIPEADLLSPAITLITQDVAAMGESAAQLLFNRLDGYAGPYENRVIPTVLTARGSGEIAPHYVH
jgi:LacI family transcriptional regulator